MGFYFAKILDEGTSNPIVARIGVQLSELLELCSIAKAKKDDLSCIFYEMMKAILSAHKEATSLIEELQSIEGEILINGLHVDQKSPVIPSSLKLDSIKVFVKHAHEALKLLAQALAVFFGQGWTEAKFEPLLKYFKSEENKRNEKWGLVDLLEGNLSWLSDILELRNVDEHKFYKRQIKRAFVENYHISIVQGKPILVRPMLCIGKEVLPFLVDANRRLFQLTEELIVSAISMFLPEGVGICQIPEEQQRKNFPKRFKHCLGVFPGPLPVA